MNLEFLKDITGEELVSDFARLSTILRSAVEHKDVFDLLYPSGIKFDYKKLINRVNGREVRLIGFGD